MSEPGKVRIGKVMSVTRFSSTDLIAAGQTGYRSYRLPVDVTQVSHSFIISVGVQQLPNRVDDIQLYLFDAQGYNAWASGQRAPSAILIPRIVNGDIRFRPTAAGDYYIILDNRHSTFTTKTVSISVSEEWIAEEEVMKLTPTIPGREVATTKGIRERLIGWFRRFSFITLVGAFVAIETGVILFGLALVSYAGGALGTKSGDPWPLLTALATGGLVLFAIFYFFFTGRPLPYHA